MFEVQKGLRLDLGSHAVGATLGGGACSMMGYSKAEAGLKIQLPMLLCQTQLVIMQSCYLHWGTLCNIWTQLQGVLKRLTKEGKNNMKAIPS